MHIDSVHNEIKHQCRQCELQFSLKGTLNRHLKKVHEGEKSIFPCKKL